MSNDRWVIAKTWCKITIVVWPIFYFKCHQKFKIVLIFILNICKVSFCFGAKHNNCYEKYNLKAILFTRNQIKITIFWLNKLCYCFIITLFFVKYRNIDTKLLKIVFVFHFFHVLIISPIIFRFTFVNVGWILGF